MSSSSREPTFRHNFEFFVRPQKTVIGPPQFFSQSSSRNPPVFPPFFLVTSILRERSPKIGGLIYESMIDKSHPIRKNKGNVRWSIISRPIYVAHYVWPWCLPLPAIENWARKRCRSNGPRAGHFWQKCFFGMAAVICIRKNWNVAHLPSGIWAIIAVKKLLYTTLWPQREKKVIAL